MPLNVVKFNQSVVDLCKKYEFNANSQIKIKDYILDKNERILKKNNKNLKITEKEINFIETLNSNKEPLTKDYILKNIWGYSSSTDTHTIETHIYRLRQKIKDSFDDENFIKNTKSGYSLWIKEIKLLRIYFPKNIEKELLSLKKGKEATVERNLRESSANFLNNFWGHFCSFFKALF